MRIPNIFSRYVTEETSWAPPEGNIAASTTEGLYDPHRQRLRAAKGCGQVQGSSTLQRLVHI